MKITPNSPIVHIGSKAQVPQAAEKGASGIEVAEKVSVSPQALSIQTDQQQIRANLGNVSDVRMDRVNQIKQEIESGAYARDPQEVADKMIAAHLSESLYRK